jgi:cell wall-associated NlpC family hydrolase
VNLANRSVLLAAASFVMMAAPARAAQNLLEAVTSALAKDDGFTDAGRQQVVDAIRERFADYGVKVVRPDGGDLAVVLRMIAEGAMDNAAPERIADVAFAAFQAVGRGAQAEVVEGIGLYGYRKQIPGERIAAWANGYGDLTKNGVPSEVGADLVRNAMEHDWDEATFNIFKWSLVQAAKDQFDVARYAAFMFQRMEEGKEGPGAITATAVSTFRKAQREGSEVPIPDYHGVFTIAKEPPAPPPPQDAGEKARQEQEEAEKAARAAAEARAKAEADEAAAKAKDERAAARAAKKKALAAQRAAEKRRKKAERAAKKAAESHAEPSGAPLEGGIAAIWPRLDAAARSYLGTPYVWGGETKKGIDCSGFTKRSYYEGASIGLPRNSRQQWNTGARVDFDKLQEGDLIFFDTMGHGVSHVGLMVDPKSNRFIHASSSKGVSEADLSQRYFKKRYLGARRVIR